MFRMRHFIGGVCITIKIRDELLPLRVFGMVIGGEKKVRTNPSVGD